MANAHTNHKPNTHEDLLRTAQDWKLYMDQGKVSHTLISWNSLVAGFRQIRAGGLAGADSIFGEMDKASERKICSGWRSTAKRVLPNDVEASSFASRL